MTNNTQNLINIWHGLGKLIKNLLHCLKDIFIACWILVLYLLSCCLVVGTSTAFNLQTEISQIALEEDIQRALQAMSNVEELRWKMDYDKKKISALKLELAYAEDELVATGLEIERLEVFSIPEDELDPFELQAKKKILNKFHDIQKNINELNKNINYRENAINDKQSRIDSLHENFKQYFSDDEKARKIRELASDYRYMRRLFFGELVTMPGFLLTLILSISMGSLGSVIHLTWEFFDKAKERKASYYFFRPFLGGVLAFCIYILLKSGQMFFTASPHSGSMSAELNPFLISFLSIVSGMLSQQAYERISNAGTRILAIPKVEHLRWIRASTLKPIMEKQQKDSSSLVPYVQETKEKIEEWFEEKEPVSENNQLIVSAWLGVPVRDLFSDQGPLDSERNNALENNSEETRAANNQVNLEGDAPSNNGKDKK